MARSSSMSTRVGEVAGSYFGIVGQQSPLSTLVRDIDTLLKMKGAFSAGIMSATQELRSARILLLAAAAGRWAVSFRYAPRFLERMATSIWGLSIRSVRRDRGAGRIESKA